MSRQLSPDEEDAVLCLLAVRRRNTQTNDSDDIDGLDDNSSCFSKAQKTLSSEDDVPNMLSQPHCNVGALSPEDPSTAVESNRTKATTKKKMICECGALILVRTQWKHKQSKKHIQFMLNKLAFQKGQLFVDVSNPFSQEHQQPQRCDDERLGTPQEQPHSHLLKMKSNSELQKERSYDNNAGFSVTNSMMYGWQGPQIIFVAPMHDLSSSQQQLGVPMNQPTAPLFTSAYHNSARQEQSLIMAQPSVFYFAHPPQQQQWQQSMMAPFGHPSYSLF